MHFRDNPTLGCWAGLAFIFVAGVVFNVLENGAAWFTGGTAEIVKTIVTASAIVSGFAVAAHASTLTRDREDRARELERATTFEAFRAVLLSSHNYLRHTVNSPKEDSNRIAHARVAIAFMDSQLSALQSFDALKLGAPRAVQTVTRCVGIVARARANYGEALAVYEQTDRDSHEREVARAQLIRNLRVAANAFKRTFDRFCVAMKDERASPLVVLDAPAAAESD